MSTKRPLQPKDVVRILDNRFTLARTGVVNRRDETTGMINVFTKAWDHGIWFFESNLKRIGRVK